MTYRTAFYDMKIERLRKEVEDEAPAYIALVDAKYSFFINGAREQALRAWLAGYMKGRYELVGAAETPMIGPYHPFQLGFKPHTGVSSSIALYHRTK